MTRSRCPGSTPAAPGGGSSATWSRRAPASPGGSSRGTARIASRAAMITIGRTSSARVSEPAARMKPRSSGPRTMKAEAEDSVDDRGHRGEVLDVDLDQPVPPARLVGVLLEVDRGADADRDDEEDHAGDQHQRADDRRAEAGVLGVERRGRVGEELGAERRGAFDEGLDEQRDEPGERDQRPRAAAGRRRAALRITSRARLLAAASPPSSPARPATARRVRSVGAPARRSLVDLAVPADEPDAEQVHHQRHQEEHGADREDRFVVERPGRDVAGRGDARCRRSSPGSTRPG